MLLGAVWGLLTSTRLLRGEEDGGRWELLLAGRTTRRRAAAQALAGLGAGAGALWALTAILTVGVGLDSSVKIAAGPALYFALAMAATAVMFLAVGALASQLAPTRRQAASYAAAFLGGCYAVRMIADAGVGLHGLIWASPLGWVEELRPFAGPQPLALLPIAAFTAAAGRRGRPAGRRPRRRRGHPAGPGPQRAAAAAAVRPGRPGDPAGPADRARLVDRDRAVGAAVRADREVGRDAPSPARRRPGRAGQAGRHRDRHRRRARGLLPRPGGADRLRRAPGRSPPRGRKSRPGGSTTSWPARSPGPAGWAAGC